MSEAGNRATIEALMAAINARDLEALDKVFTEDVIMEWPQSGERIRGGKNRREIYSRFPSLPKVTPAGSPAAGRVGCWRPHSTMVTESRTRGCSSFRCGMDGLLRRSRTGPSLPRPQSGGRRGSSACSGSRTTFQEHQPKISGVVLSTLPVAPHHRGHLARFLPLPCLRADGRRNGRNSAAPALRCRCRPWKGSINSTSTSQAGWRSSGSSRRITPRTIFGLTGPVTLPWCQGWPGSAMALLPCCPGGGRAVREACRWRRRSAGAWLSTGSSM